MQAHICQSDAPKKSANLSINSDLLRQAREHLINLSRALEQRLIEMLLEAKRCQWREENRDAIATYNRLEKYAVGGADPEEGAPPSTVALVGLGRSWTGR